jgi:hypothetical protein
MCRHPVGCRICAAGMLARTHCWPPVSRRSSGSCFTTSGGSHGLPFLPNCPGTVSPRRRGGSPGAVSHLGGNSWM